MTRLAFLAGFLLGWYARLGPNRAFVARAVWHELERDPAFLEGMRKGRADIAAHVWGSPSRGTATGGNIPWTGSRIVNNSTIRDGVTADEPGGGW